MGKSRLFGESAACRENARILGCVKTSVNHVAKQVLFLAAFVFLYAGAWAQASTTIASASGDALHLEVRGVDDASVSATPVERTSPNGKQLYCAYDIDITKDGREWQPEPEQPAMVTMENPDFADGQLLDIYHEGASGLEFVATVASENGKITFPAHSFSVYIVAQAPEYNRLKVVFHRAGGESEDVTIYVKPQDLAEGYGFNSIVYNPGFGPIHDGLICKGWTTNPNYTEADAREPLTFDGVRATITSRLNAGVADGDVLDIYALLFKSFSVSYLDHNDAVIKTDQMLYSDTTVSSIEYRVNAPYTTDDSHKFEGWIYNRNHNDTIINIVGHTEDTHNYANGTTITITRDVFFDVNLSEGNWLVFHENGKGGTYNAPLFVLRGQNATCPLNAQEDNMVRYGYHFDGWYTDSLCTNGNEFSFGSPILGRTEIYAKWEANTIAPYTVLMWTQNQARTAYELKESYVNNRGNVGQNIPYTFVNNGDEDYVTGVGADNGHYIGFCLTEASKDQQVTITPEGDAVLNLYYDRIEYNFKFYLYCNGSGNNKYNYANNSSNGREYFGQTNANSNNTSLVTWHVDQSAHPSVVSPYTLQSETVGGRTYYYYLMTAYYGEDITNKWLSYDKIRGANGRDAVSYVMMVGTKLKPRPSADGDGTIKGIVTILDENILGATNDVNGNYMVVRFPRSYNSWKYHIWYEAIDGVVYENMTEYNGKKYYEDTVLNSRSSNTDVTKQNPPAYMGFGTGLKMGQNWTNGNSWTTGNNPETYHINMVYDRLKYPITYFDGNYVDGDNNVIENRATQTLHTSEDIGQGVRIADDYRTYVPTLPQGYEGFLFEGWYLDEGCITPYTWGDMTIGGIKVYAKWRQIQYRVFLHPNVDTADHTLTWGTTGQQMNFRRSYGNKISVPKGLREDYEQVGWYTDENFENVFNESFVLNESTVTTTYDKTTDFTDPMDEYGILGENPRCSDANRFWVTKKYDLYAKWRAQLRGANGITVVYDHGHGTPSSDTAKFLYQDNVPVIVNDACSSPNESLVFSHWVLMHYNGSSFVSTDTHIYPGSTFNVRKSDSRLDYARWYNPSDDTYIDEPDPRNMIAPDDTHTLFKASYTVMLRAVYEQVGKPSNTYIKWFDNYGGTARVDGGDSEPHTLAINDAVLPPVPTRTGYNFKGWYRQRVASGEVPTTVAVCTPNFLYYNTADSKYYSEAAYTNEVTKVAADLYLQTDYLYAIWEPKVEFTLVSNVCQGNPLPLPTTTDGNVVLEGSWSAPAGGTIEGSYYTAASVTSTTLTFTPSTSSYPSKCASAKDFDVSFQTPDASLSSYDYIWKGGAASPADWNTTSNWYVYESGYKIATTLPAIDKNIYIGPSQCVTSNWPSQSNEAFAKNITIASTATLTIPEGKTLNIAGNLDNIGTLSASGTVVFCGPSSDGGDQIITNNVEFKNVVFNNLGGNIRPRGNVEINGEATFTSGILEIEAVKFNANSTAVVSSHRSFVSGRVEKTVGELNENFTFPTGSHASGQPDVLGSVSSELPKEKTISVTFYQKSANNGDGTLGFTIDEYPRWWNVADMCPGNGPQLDHVSNYEYWKVNTDVDLVATLTVDAANASAHFGTPNAYSSDMVYAAMYTGGCWKNISNEHGTISDNHQSMSVVANIPRVSLRADEPQIVTLGSTDRSTLLPIELLSFDAECNGNSVELAWATASEKNNDYFSLERSDDAINFTEIARIAGAGNSIERLDYSYTDFGVHGGDNYYRLVQVDYDGTRTASEIIVANCSDMPTEEPEVIAYPNPFDSDLTVELENFGDRPARIDVYDVLGRLVYTEEVAAPQNDYQTVLHLGGLSDATYTVRVATSDFVINRKVVKQQ